MPKDFSSIQLAQRERRIAKKKIKGSNFVRNEVAINLSTAQRCNTSMYFHRRIITLFTCLAGGVTETKS